VTQLPAPLVGRPSKYDAGLAQRVLDAMCQGATTAEACRRIGVKRSTFRGWARDDRDGLAARYIRAQKIQIMIWQDDTLEIVDFAPGTPAQIERQLNRINARCERIETTHARIAAAARDVHSI
jgi:transposase-like protein